RSDRSTVRYAVGRVKRKSDNAGALDGY
ncbi:MAG: hypothetical protein QOC58_876, partial [Mycobacterium sp.]|nr:hypothetical protein [Mycobacterium sp.]